MEAQHGTPLNAELSCGPLDSDFVRMERLTFVEVYEP
jgi:hypothetical protein